MYNITTIHHMDINWLFHRRVWIFLEKFVIRSGDDVPKLLNVYQGKMSSGCKISVWQGTWDGKLVIF